MVIIYNTYAQSPTCRIPFWHALMMAYIVFYETKPSGMANFCINRHRCAFVLKVTKNNPIKKETGMAVKVFVFYSMAIWFKKSSDWEQEEEVKLIGKISYHQSKTLQGKKNCVNLFLPSSLFPPIISTLGGLF